MDVIVSVDDFRTAARRRVPRWLFDYVDGGSYAEATLLRNRSCFNEHPFLPRVLRQIAQPDTTTTVLGVKHAFPLILSPVGMGGMLSAAGEGAAARAAADATLSMCVSHFSIASIENLARTVDPARLMFQLYIFRDRAITADMVRRAWDAGVRTLVLTVDTPVTPLRERDARNGFRRLSRLSGRQICQMASRPRWTLGVAQRSDRVIGNLVPYSMGRTLFEQAATISRSLDPAIGWADVAWLRQLWKGQFVLKGILHPEDTERAAGIGADAVILSNHGGRQLDGAVAALETLEANVATAAGRLEILVDGGFRYGNDIMRALTLGARAVMVGRPWAYALAAGGEKGVRDLLTYFHEGLQSGMSLLGADGIQNLQEENYQVPV
ncbi:alpha-hydroxy acid oxidase [Acetobacter tropicalis]|uniref:FMN-dependent dehydrogenase n=1 Tax=Acetobacter tropicalis TaxID=104102 RepID=A0A252A4K4_9PROT|nr:alpha-hydroxy acid oxidase [Acetobacter tropicalis]OUI84158.1 FMN-dependent dehydrogenase [Acetobacter tropicalis]